MIAYKVFKQGAMYTALIADGKKEIASKNFGTRSAAEAFINAFRAGTVVKVYFKDCKGVFVDYYNSLAEFKAYLSKFYNVLFADGALKVVNILKVADLLN